MMTFRITGDFKLTKVSIGPGLTTDPPPPVQEPLNIDAGDESVNTTIETILQITVDDGMTSAGDEPVNTDTTAPLSL